MDPSMIGAIAGGVGSLVSSVNQIFTGAKNRKMANKIKPIDVQYNVNPLAQQRLGLAQQLYGGRMAGAGQAQRNIFSNQANSMAAVNRNATDSSQALAMLAGLQGNTNNALNDLQTKEEMNKQAMFEQLSGAQQGMINEQNMVYQDRLRKYQQDVQTKNALYGIGQQNTQNGINGLSNLAIMAGQGAFGSLGGGNGSGSGWQPARQGFNSSGRATGVF